MDGLRGACALIVLLYHNLLAQPAGERLLLHDEGPAALRWLLRTPAALAVAGHEAVLVFFALSGFVLAYSLEAADGFRAAPFLAKRVARVWLPFAAAIVASAALAAMLAARAVPDASRWFTDASWRLPLTPGRIAEHLLMTGRANDLDNVMWSLVHEVRISLVFPLLALAVRRAPRAAVAGSLAFSAACLAALDLALPAPLRSAAGTGQYLFLFAIGAATAFARRTVAARIAAARPAAVAGGWAVAATLLASQAVAAPAPGTVAEIAVKLASGTGAAAVVALCLVARGPARLLERATALWLGRVSYSLYLVHLPILLALGHGLAGTVPVAAVPLLAIPAALAAAALFNARIERPAQRLGRALAAPFAA